MKHAPGAPESVTLEVTATGLNVDIINGPARFAPLELDGCGGAGLPGMTERVKAHGGQLNTGPVPGGGWRVAASLPSGTPPGGTPLPLVAGSGSLRITACSVRPGTRRRRTGGKRIRRSRRSVRELPSLPVSGPGCGGRAQSRPCISIAVCDPASLKLAFLPGGGGSDLWLGLVRKARNGCGSIRVFWSLG